MFTERSPQRQTTGNKKVAAPNAPPWPRPLWRGTAIGGALGAGAGGAGRGLRRGVSRPLGLGSLWLRTQLPSVAAMEDDRKDAVYGRSSLRPVGRLCGLGKEGVLRKGDI